MPGVSTGESMLARHLRILDAFTPGAAFLTLSDIAQASGLPVSTTHRLLSDLERERLVERLPDRSYRLGLRLWELAARTPGALGLREIAFPVMQAVQASVRQHTQLGVRDGTDVVYLERLSRRDAVVNATVVGGRISLAASAIGQVLLASMPASAVDELAEAGIPPYTEATPITAAQLHPHIDRVRAQGYAICDGLVHPAALGVAVAVKGPDGDVVAGLGVVVPVEYPRPKQLVHMLSRAATGITKTLREAYVSPEHPHALPGARFRPLINSSAQSMQHFAEQHPQ